MTGMGRTDAGKTVLVVDDDPDCAAMTATVLRNDGFSVDIAENGRRGVELIENGARPAVIVLDVMMPVMDGPAFIELRNRHPVISKIPVIVVSGTKLVPDEHVEAFLEKPFDPEIFIHAVRAAAGGRCG